MKFISIQTLVSSLCSLLMVLLFSNSVKSIPPQQLFPNGMGHLKDLGGGFLPLNFEDSNLDEDSYWYQLYQDQKQVYLVLQQLDGRTLEGKAIFDFLDAVIISELANSNTYGIMRGGSDICKYSDNQVLRDTSIIMIVKYNKDTATPIKSFRANYDFKKWEKPSASLIKGLVCEIPFP